MTRFRNATWWIAPSLVCLIVHWHGFNAWFRGDDFAWLGLTLRVHGFHSLMAALFTPFAEGTIRPWSERAFFMAGFSLFGLDALPFRIVIFATQFANLALAAAIGSRIGRSRAAGFCAAMLWAVHSAVASPLAWTCVYNQVLCAFFLLLALYCLARYLETADRRWEMLQWAAFLLGFGAQELNFVYPMLAVGYLVLVAAKPRPVRRVLPMFAVSAAYVVAHLAAAPPQKTGVYAMHYTRGMVKTLARYWTWSAGPAFLWTPVPLPAWVMPAGVAVLTLALLVFAAMRLRAGLRVPLFCLGWYLATLVPVLPLRDHRMEYYLYIPAIGLCWLGGWGLAEAWRGTRTARFAAAALALLYLVMVVPRTVAASDWNYRASIRVRDLVEGLARIHELHPAQAVMLEGVDSPLFWNGIFDRPARLLGIERLYLAPGSEARIPAVSDAQDVAQFVLPPAETVRALERDELVVYDVRGPRLRNITATYRPAPDLLLPPRVDTASPLAADLLGPEWYPSDSDHRWMPKRATLRMAAPAAPGRTLYLHGYCPDAQLQAGPLGVTVTVNGSALPPAEIHQNAFDLAFPLPDSAAGKPQMQVAVEVSRTIRPANDPRDLGLAFGTFEVR